MKKLVSNLKENSNNILILAIVFSLGISFIFELEFLVSDLYYCIVGEEGYSWSEEASYIIETMVLAVVIAVTLFSAIMASAGNRKWIGLSIGLLICLMVYNVSPGILNCLILAIVWNKNAKSGTQANDSLLLKIAVILAAISFTTVLVLPLYGLILLLMSPNNVDSAWMMFVFGSQLLSFIIKPEIIVMIYLFRKSKKQEEPVYRKFRKVTKIYFVLWILLAAIMLVADLAQEGLLSQWFGISDGAGVEAGDWSEWETE